MPTARCQQIDLTTTSYYHCFVRCVRKAYLCGIGDNGQDYNHRRAWIENKLQVLPKAFAIQVTAYAIMHNHYHVILHVNKTQALSWSDEEVINHWRLVAHVDMSIPPSAEKIAQWRENLYSISWFMRFLNESVARKANREDDVTGRFWEGRFKSQALADMGAVLACSAYVDLNPIRAKIATTLENSDFTSIQKRTDAYRKEQPTPISLMSFQSECVQQPTLLSTMPFSLKDYIELVDWTGRQIIEKKGVIADNVPAIVKSVGLNPVQWMHTVTYYGSEYQGIAGALSKVKAWAEKIGQKFIRHQNLSKSRYFSYG